MKSSPKQMARKYLALTIKILKMDESDQLGSGCTHEGEEFPSHTYEETIQFLIEGLKKE